ncbi:methionyl-tRNA formyltransferase, mitochondrial isoform X1 [Halictus rubicundus]|uniref:methionyl-tRNA formyltransferase, mitochondrial isoform X1 n=1 Tax=Halictus rubicundus TaxID=77578 RepID=UPI004036360F
MSISNVRTLRSKQFICSFKKLRKVLTFNVKREVHINCHAFNKESDQLPNSGPWNVLFFGTNGFAAESLKTLYNKYDSKIVQCLEVVTLKTAKENAVINIAKEKELTIHYWPLDKAIYNFHIGIVVSFGHLIPSKIINSFPLGMLNVHGSLLPRWRGAAPIIYSLMNGDDQTGVTIMRIKPKKFDIGEIILQKEVNIGEHETLPQLHSKLAKLGAYLLEKTFEDLPGALRSAKPQNEANATYAPKITSKIAIVKWDEMSATNIYNLHRALVGLYPLSTRLGNKTVKLYDVMITHKSIAKKFIEKPPGMVTYDKVSNELIIKCKGAGCISVKRISVQGKSVMTAGDFNNGYIIGKNETYILFS